MSICVFCDIVHGRAEAEVVDRWPDAIAIRPLNPVVDGHLLVIPRGHASDALEDPIVTATVMARAAQLGRLYGCDLNLITSVGAAATQTVRHLHVHVVPRFEDDGLTLPWTGQQEPDDLDQFVREQAEQDPAFASAYVNAQHVAEIRAHEDLLASVWLHIDWRTVTRKLTTDQQALFADSVDAHADRIAEADPAYGQPARADRWWDE